MHARTQTHTKARWITVSFITPQGAILCTTEIWRIPSLINVEAAPINIFISAYAPCWKHIQGDFKLYELISYLLRQLSMPTPTSLSTPYIFSSHSPSPPPPHAHLLPSMFFFFFPLHFSTLQKWDWSIRGFTWRPTSLEDLKFPFRFNRLVWGKFERKNPLTAWRHTIW